jgi:hypothetical protein
MLLLVGLVAAAFVPLAVMWAAVGGFEAVGYLLAFAAYFLVFHVALPGYVYADARARGSDAVVAWTALTFLVPPLAAAVYLLLARRGSVADAAD